MTAHPGILDVAAAAAPDFICIDTQHGVDISSLSQSSFTTLAYYSVPALVRVQSIDEALIGRALDLGADGVVVPLVTTADDARRAVAATRYAPEGARSFGVQTRRLSHRSHTAPVCWIQIETDTVMGQLNEIAALDGVDALYIGPADLGLALCAEPAADVESVFAGSHPHAEPMLTAFQSVVAACQGAGIPAGLHCGNGRAAARSIEHGFAVTSVGADLSLIGNTLKAELITARSQSA